MYRTIFRLFWGTFLLLSSGEAIYIVTTENSGTTLKSGQSVIFPHLCLLQRTESDEGHSWLLMLPLGHLYGLGLVTR